MESRSASGFVEKKCRKAPQGKNTKLGKKFQCGQGESAASGCAGEILSPDLRPMVGGTQGRRHPRRSFSIFFYCSRQSCRKNLGILRWGEHTVCKSREGMGMLQPKQQRKRQEHARDANAARWACKLAAWQTVGDGSVFLPASYWLGLAPAISWPGKRVDEASVTWL